jgi:hypothetical protein
MQYTRQHDFQVGTTIIADNIDNEFNAVQAVINGNIDTDNIQDDAITSDKIASGAIGVRDIVNPYKFQAARTTNQAIGDSAWTTVQLNVEQVDTNNNFDPATYMYTIPVTGYYAVSAIVDFVQPDNNGFWGLGCAIDLLNGSDVYQGNLAINYLTFYPSARIAGTSLTCTCSCYYLTAGYKLKLVAFADPYTAGNTNVTGARLNGHLISV